MISAFRTRVLYVLKTSESSKMPFAELEYVSLAILAFSNCKSGIGAETIFSQNTSVLSRRIDKSIYFDLFLTCIYITLLCCSVCVIINVIGRHVRFDQVVCNDVGVGSGAIFVWSETRHAVSQPWHNPGFVKGDPQLNFVSIFTEAEVRVVSEAVNNGLVHPPSFFLFQGLWKIPVI